MSEKERQKKDGADKNKKNQRMNEPPEQVSEERKDKDRPAQFREGLPRNDREGAK